MSKLLPHQWYVANIQGRIDENNKRLYMPKEEALAELKMLTGVDFGYDIKAWQKWLKKNRYTFYEKYKKYVKEKYD